MKISVSELGLNVCGLLNTCRIERAPILVTTRREVTHVIVPVNNSNEAEAFLSYCYNSKYKGRGEKC
jgi:hypothetical protein